VAADNAKSKPSPGLSVVVGGAVSIPERQGGRVFGRCMRALGDVGEEPSRRTATDFSGDVASISRATSEGLKAWNLIDLIKLTVYIVA